jgi:hypothetical protein
MGFRAPLATLLLLLIATLLLLLIVRTSPVHPLSVFLVVSFAVFALIA